MQKYEWFAPNIRRTRWQRTTDPCIRRYIVPYLGTLPGGGDRDRGRERFQMRLVGAPLIAEFAERRPDAKKDLDAWRLEVQIATWANPHELKARYPKASIIKGREVVFNIRNNRYRMHVTVDYQSGTVIVRRLGTHAEYDKWTF